MKLFECQNCGHALYFENTACERCHHKLGYLPETKHSKRRRAGWPKLDCAGRPTKALSLLCQLGAERLQLME